MSKFKKGTKPNQNIVKLLESLKMPIYDKEHNLLICLCYNKNIKGGKSVFDHGAFFQRMESAIQDSPPCLMYDASKRGVYILKTCLFPYDVKKGIRAI